MSFDSHPAVSSPAARGARQARRVRQTLRDFDNGPRILAGIVGRRLLGRPAELLFEMESGFGIVCPNVRGALVPVYEVFAEDAYRLDWFTQGLPEKLSAVDIGGHIGCFTTALARLRPDARIQTFEASPTTFGFLERNVARNGLAARVTVNNIALSSHEGTLEFADNAGGSGLNGLTAPEGSSVVHVPCIPLGSAFARAGGHVDLVKIDTEGAEYDIVLSSGPEDWSSVQRVVMEYHDVAGHSWAELADFFARAGLEVVRHEPVNERLGTVWLSRGPIPATAGA